MPLVTNYNVNSQENERRDIKFKVCVQTLDYECIYVVPPQSRPKYLVSSYVDLLREPVACRAKGPSDVASFHHLHQVSDDLDCGRTHKHTY